MEQFSDNRWLLFFAPSPREVHWYGVVGWKIEVYDFRRQLTNYPLVSPPSANGENAQTREERRGATTRDAEKTHLRCTARVCFVTLERERRFILCHRKGPSNYSILKLGWPWGEIYLKDTATKLGILLTCMATVVNSRQKGFFCYYGRWFAFLKS